MEDVLCTIYTIELSNNIPRNSAIASACNMRRNMVTHWGTKLGALGLIQLGKYAYYMLTEEGLPVAKRLYERRMALATELQKAFGISWEFAFKQADAWEHDLCDNLLVPAERIELHAH